jgi:branched-chain amino acid transport system substrate-binding protein
VGPDAGQRRQQDSSPTSRPKYGTYPSFYAAQAYDAIMLIASGREAPSTATWTTRTRCARRCAAISTAVRGEFKFGNNHLPIQDFYLREVVADDDGNWTTKVVQTVFEDHQDSYAAECNWM